MVDGSVKLPDRQCIALRRSKAFVHSEAVLDFLKDAVASAPDLPDDDGKPKRKRCDPR